LGEALGGLLDLDRHDVIDLSGRLEFGLGLRRWFV
jgi:hypothetical protein